MHDPEKSDSAVVAVKPPNQAGSPAAEALEPRAGTKGNADQQSTHRTQTRGSAAISRFPAASNAKTGSIRRARLPLFTKLNCALCH